MGVKYFQCKPGKGKFALLSALYPDKRNKKIPGTVCNCSLLLSF